MPDKFEKATLLLRLGVPSTLQRTYPHKKIRENGTFRIRSLEWNNLKTQRFFLLVWTENFSYPELFEYAHVILSCDLSSHFSRSEIQHGGQHDVFCVVDNNFFFNRLFRVK